MILPIFSRLYKPAILVLFFCMIQRPGFAQVPDYFGNNPEWRMRFQIGAMSDCLTTDDYVYYVNGDTLIDTTTYKKIFRRKFTSYTIMAPGGCVGSNPSFSNQFVEVVRQEGRKIYGRNVVSDTLLYDFDMDVGDTILTNQGILIINQVDSIIIGGEYHRQLHVNGNPSVSTLIEGIGQEIGYTGGLLDPYPPYFEHGFQFICYSNNGIVELGAGSWPLCYFNVGLEEQPGTFNLYGYPNPADEFIHLNNIAANNISIIRIFDQLGSEQLLSFDVINEDQIIIHLNRMVPGIYCIQVQMTNGSLGIFKIKKI